MDKVDILKNNNFDINEIVKTIFYFLPVGIVLLNDKDECYFANKSILNILKIENVDEKEFFYDKDNQNLLNRKISNFIGGEYYNKQFYENSEDCQDLHNSCSEDSKIIKSIEIEGKKYWFEIIIYNFLNKENNNKLIVISDISEFKNNELRYRKMSHYDFLTGLYNRNYFEEHMKFISEHCSRSKKPLSIIMIDIDNFKLINDKYGHMAGDIYIKSVSNAIKKTILRKTDFASRFGGDEFIVALPYSDRKGAMIVAKRIADNIRDLSSKELINQYNIDITTSMGIYTAKTKKKEQMIDLTEAIKRADYALYQVKKRGKNSIGVFDIKMEQIFKNDPAFNS